jgi:hypothetical protein
LLGKPSLEVRLSESALGVRLRLRRGQLLDEELWWDRLLASRLSSTTVRELARLFAVPETGRLSGLSDALQPATVSESAAPLKKISQDPGGLGGLSRANGAESFGAAEVASERIETTEPAGVAEPDELGLKRRSRGDIVF